jgi:hypothetical protein
MSFLPKMIMRIAPPPVPLRYFQKSRHMGILFFV